MSFVWWSLTTIVVMLFIVIALAPLVIPDKRCELCGRRLDPTRDEDKTCARCTGCDDDCDRRST